MQSSKYIKIPKYNYPTMNFACHWHAICHQYASCVYILKALNENEKDGNTKIEEETKHLMELINATVKKREKELELINNILSSISADNELEHNKAIIMSSLTIINELEDYEKSTIRDLLIFFTEVKTNDELLSGCIDKINDLKQKIIEWSNSAQKAAQTDIDRMKLIPDARKLLIETFLAVHDDFFYERYAKRNQSELFETIRRLFDININSFDFIMDDCAKVYQYCLKWYVPMEILVVYNDTHISLTEVIQDYHPMYIIINSTHFRANTHFSLGSDNYAMASLTEGSGHFYCNHICDGICYRFDDRSSKLSHTEYPLHILMQNISEHERVSLFRKPYLSNTMLHMLRTLPTFNEYTDKELSDEELGDFLKEVYVRSGLDDTRQYTCDEIICKINSEEFHAFIQTLPESRIPTKVSLSLIRSAIEKQRNRDRFFTTQYVDQTLYATAMSVRND